VSPRFSPDGKSLVYLTTDKVWYHMSCARLRRISWGTESPAVTVVDCVESPENLGDFPGLWLLMLPERTWMGDSRHIVVNSLWNITSTLLVIDVFTGQINRLKGSAATHGLASMAVLDVFAQYALVKESTPLQTHQVHLVEILGSEKEKDENSAATEAKKVGGGVVPSVWTCVRAAVKLRDSDLQEKLSKATFRVLDIDTEDKSAANGGQFQALLLLPGTQKEACPLVLRPHGGPHSAFATGFDWGNVLMVLKGFAVCCVNYRGSIGYGQAALKSLPGKCGRQDVDDCMSALEKTLSLEAKVPSSWPRFDQKRIMAWGGSHGGFLTTHFIGQFPDKFKMAATRNPVTDVAFMVTETDIPDWCYCEGGGDYDAAHMPSGEDYKKFFEMSPVSHATKIKTPLLMLLGLKDLRVPPSQGLNFHRTLKARGVKTKCLVYPKSTHSLSDSVRTEGDVWINVLKWFSADE